MKKIYIETERLQLREMNLNEAQLLFDLDSDPEVMKYLSGGVPTGIETCNEAIIKLCDYYERYDRKFGLWFAEERATSKCIGWFLLRPDKKNPNDIKNPELGYRFKKKFWGKGYGTEGSSALLVKAFTELDCDSVFAITMSENLASQNIMKKIGMQFMGDYDQEECFAPGGDSSTVKYVITRGEWLNAKEI